MPFAYCDRLTRAPQRVSRQRDDIASASIPRAEELRLPIGAVAEALADGDRARLQAAADRVVAEIALQLRVPPLRTRVLAVRPSHR